MNTDVNTTRKLLEQKRQELAGLEEALAVQMQRQIESLPRMFGLSSIDAVIMLLLPVASAEMRSRMEGSASTDRTKGRRVRAAVTQELRLTIVNLLKEQRFTAAEIAQRAGVSSSLVNQIKRAEGLTRPLSKRDRTAGNRLTPS